MDTTQTLQKFLSQKRRIVDAALEEYLPDTSSDVPVIHEAMRYSIFAGGKRLRPIMLLMTAEMFEQECKSIVFAAAALEMVHTYSLIHDDLPAMDDDDLRRGRPTNHKVYGEAIAILAGDALLTLAFQLMTDPRHMPFCSPASLLSASHELAIAAGTFGMLGGQVLDIQAEGRKISSSELTQIHQRKTGKLLTAAVRIGAILAEADPRQLAAVTEYGENVGLAFQIVDDILDLEGSVEELGKYPERDLQLAKATYPALHGLEASKKTVNILLNNAKQALYLFEDRAYYLHQLTDYMGTRTN